MNSLALLATFTLSLPCALAQVDGPPAAIDYQGRVLDNNGDPIAPGAPQNIEMYFRIWDDISASAGENLIWGEKQIVTVLDGNFSVRLGEGSPIESSAGDNVVVGGIDDPYPPLTGAFAGSSRYLGMSVAANSSVKPQSEILPRLAFLASPFSMVAERAKYAEFGPTGGTFEAASVGVGIDTPVAPLHVHGSSTFGNAFGANGSNATNVLNILAGENASGAENGITFYENSSANSGMSFGYDGVGAGSPALRLYGFDGGALVSFGEDGDVGIGTENPAAASALHVTRPDNEIARIYATGNLQGSGEFFAGQSPSVGGGFAFHGDGAPSHVGGNDRVVFFRRNAGVNHEVFSYGYNSDHARFNGRVGVGGAESATHRLHVIGDSNSTGDVFAGQRIGIGTTDPKGLLHINSTADANLADGTGALLIGDEDGANLVLDSNEIAARNNGAAALLHINPHGGNIRIGGGTNQYGLLSVNAATTYDLGWAWLHGIGQSASNDDRGFEDIAIGTDKRMRADGYFVKSDARTKTVVGVSDSADDLKTLMGVEVTDYTYTDVHTNGDDVVKKVIAQQVEEVFPQAVSRGAGTVPDIYKLAPSKGGWIEIETGLEVGERVKLIAKDGEGIYGVLEIRDGAFRTEFESTAGEVFVFGREVDDFRTVDYDAIAMLNVSATQELYRSLSSKTEQISALEERLAAIERRLAGDEYVTATVAQ